MLTLVILVNWYTKVINVQGAFLHGYFQRQTEKLYASVPNRFENYYPPNSILAVLKTIYGTIQGVLQWWREICKALYYLDWRRHAIDPCLFVKWVDGYLLMFLVWVDNCALIGPEHIIKKEQKQFQSLFDTTDKGNME